jgi:predicted ester cyclase
VILAKYISLPFPKNWKIRGRQDGIDCNNACEYMEYLVKKYGDYPNWTFEVISTNDDSDDEMESDEVSARVTGVIMGHTNQLGKTFTFMKDMLTTYSFKQIIEKYMGGKHRMMEWVFNYIREVD